MTPAVRVLEAANIDFELSEYERHLSGDGNLRDFGVEAAEALGLPTQQVFKTLLVTTDQGENVVAIAPVSCMLSLKLVAAAVGAKKASMCAPADAERSSGYVVGGISPLGQRKQLRTVVDESVELFETVYVSGGKRGLDIGLAPDDLVDVLDATVSNITA